MAKTPVMHDENAGKVVYHTITGEPAISYYLYVPAKVAGDGKILALVHGISRNADEIIVAFSKYADDYGVILVAPVFGTGRFTDFQRLGRVGRGERADLALQRVLAEVSEKTQIPTDKVFLYGNSGGGQFVHRYTMAYPGTVHRYAISAAGWYTAPDLSIRFPYGFEDIKTLPGVHFDIENFLRIPACVFVGDEDTERDQSLNVSHQIDAKQGVTRLERAKWWVSAITAAARWRDIDTAFELHVLPRVGHDFTDMEDEGGISRAVLGCLFDKR